MKLEVRHYGRVRGGKVIFDLPALYEQELIGLEGKDVVLTIKKRHQKPTMSQYNYYRGIILMACYQSEMFSSADNKDQIHDEYFAPKFLSYKKMSNFGDKKEIVKELSLSELDKDQMTEFISKVLADCAHNNIHIDSPEIYYSKYYQK